MMQCIVYVYIYIYVLSCFFLVAHKTITNLLPTSIWRVVESGSIAGQLDHSTITILCGHGG